MSDTLLSWDSEPRKIIVVLPAFNEAARIANLLHAIHLAMKETPYEYFVVVVNDGSSDATADKIAQCAKHMPIEVLTHEVNKGLGVTIRDGLYYAAERANDRDIVITMDADDTHTPGLMLRMVRMVTEGHDVVIASRYQPGSIVVGVPLVRRLLSGVASLVLRALFPIRGVKDFTCGYRAYKANILRAAISRYGTRFLDQDGFQCMVDILIKLRKMPCVFGEVPFVLRYDMKEGATKMNVRKTVTKTLALLAKRKFGHLQTMNNRSKDL